MLELDKSTKTKQKTTLNQVLNVKSCSFCLNLQLTSQIFHSMRSVTILSHSSH